MTDSIFNQSIDCAASVLHKLKTTGIAKKESYADTYLSKDFSFESDTYRRAHLSIIDARETKKLLMMHCTILPHVDDPSPIFGFDIIAGSSRASGAFQDFSSSGQPDHPMMLWFAERSKSQNWNKGRDLPDWAERIFSPYMIAIGSVDSNELGKFISIGLENLDYYLAHVGTTRTHLKNFSESQNYYCKNQSLNPHTPRFMMSLGLSAELANEFMNEVLFPQV